MMNTKMFKSILATLMIVAVMFVGMGTVSADSDLPFYNTGDETGLRNDLDQDSTALNEIVSTMYNFAMYLSAIIFGVAVIVIVYAGFKYATSQGNAQQTEVAKMQIVYAGVGIGIAIFAMVIVRVFVEIFE